MRQRNLFLILAVLAVAGAGMFFALHGKPRISPVPVSSQTEKIYSEKDKNPADFTLVEQVVTLANGKVFKLQIPEGFGIVPAAEGLKRVRFMSESVDGRLFLTDMYDLTDNTKGKIYILGGFNKETHRFSSVTTYLSGLRNPNSVAFYTDKEGKNWLYIALTDKLIRYLYREGDNAPSSEPETLATFPDYGLSYKYGGWHLTRSIEIHNDTLYVSVGSSCNVCEERKDEEMRASIIAMNMNGGNQRIYARGLRNAVGIGWAWDALFATEMGSDHLGDDKPDDTFYKIEEDRHYGWPYCYKNGGVVYDDTTKEWLRKNILCENVPGSFAVFKAHSAPLGFEYFGLPKTDPVLQNSLLVALHGSGKVKIGNGYSIVRVTKGGIQKDFITGFLQNGERVGRPVDILQTDNSSFIFTDDHNGVIYSVFRK